MPVLILLQETRSMPKIRGYTTYSEPSITHQGKVSSPTQPSVVEQAAVLVRSDLGCCKVSVPGQCSKDHEVVIVQVRLPDGKPLLAASVYYRPVTGSQKSVKYNWLRHLVLRYPHTLIVIGGDFNAKSTTWGYDSTDGRGSCLEAAIDDCGLSLLNDPTLATRVGLHRRQKNTSPDLTIATTGVIRTWSPYTTTWGSDHYPILLTLRGKRFRTRQYLSHIDWQTFRTALRIPQNATLPQFTAAIHSAKAHATEEILCDSATPALDAHLTNLWKRVQTLTTRYLTNGKRHRDLIRIRRQYQIIRQYQRSLSNEHWHSLCAKLGKERGLSRLWSTFRSLSGKRKGKPTLFASLTLRDPPADVEHRLITTFFPTCLTQSPPSAADHNGFRRG